MPVNEPPELVFDVEGVDALAIRGVVDGQSKAVRTCNPEHVSSIPTNGSMLFSTQTSELA